LYIASVGPQTKYEIETGTEVNHASIHDAVEKFKRMRVLMGEAIGLTRTGQQKIRYRLTLYGFCLAIEKLMMRNADRKVFGKIVEKGNCLEPLILGKWSYLSKYIPKHELDAALVSSAWSIATGDAETLRGELKDFFAELFFTPLLDVWPQPLLFTVDDWTRAVQEDEELRGFITQKLMERKRSYASSLEQEIKHQEDVLRKMGMRACSKESRQRCETHPEQEEVRIKRMVKRHFFKPTFLHLLATHLYETHGTKIKETLRAQLLSLIHIRMSGQFESVFWFRRYSLISDYFAKSVPSSKNPLSMGLGTTNQVSFFPGSFHGLQNSIASSCKTSETS